MYGANRENTTMLAVCCTDGTVLDPLIIFQHNHLQSTWLDAELLGNIYSRVSAVAEWQLRFLIIGSGFLLKV